MRVSRGRVVLASIAAGVLIVAVVGFFGVRAALSTPTYTVTADFPERRRASTWATTSTCWASRSGP